MAKAPTLIDVSSGYTSSQALGSNFDAIEEAFENTLSLDGSTPNAMNADLDMNNNDIVNANSIFVGGANLLALLNHITISASAPSGGVDGDVWFRISS